MVKARKSPAKLSLYWKELLKVAINPRHLLDGVGNVLFALNVRRNDDMHWEDRELVLAEQFTVGLICSKNGRELTNRPTSILAATISPVQQAILQVLRLNCLFDPIDIGLFLENHSMVLVQGFLHPFLQVAQFHPLVARGSGSAGMGRIEYVTRCKRVLTV
jgi:hypothetical protein